MTNYEQLAREFRDKIDANIIATRKLLKEVEMTPEELLEMVDIFPSWESLIGTKPSLDTKFKYEGKLYKIISATTHTFQENWLPTTAVSLYVEIIPEGVIPIWVQPIGTQDAYSFGDKVTYNGEVWISVMDGTDNNTTVPDGDIPYNRYWIPVV